MPNKNKHFVYVIAHPSEPDYCKIGITGDLTNRLRGYQTGAPNRNYAFTWSNPCESREQAVTVERNAWCKKR